MERFRRRLQEHRQRQDIGLNPTTSDSYDDPVIEINDDALSETPSSDSESMGLAIPSGYLLPPPSISSSTGAILPPGSVGSNSSTGSGRRGKPRSPKNDQDIHRLVMLAKHPDATENQVADAVKKQQQMEEAKRASAERRKHTKPTTAFPVDADTGEAWDKQQEQQSRTVHRVKFASRDGEEFDQVWASYHPDDPEHQQQSVEQYPDPPKSYFWASFAQRASAWIRPSDGDPPLPDCNASREASLGPSISSEKTPKISNVDPKRREKRRRREAGQMSTMDRVEKAWKRLTRTRNGVIILCLILVVFLALIVTVAAAVASGNNKDDDALNLEKPFATMNPEPGLYDRYPSMAPTRFLKPGPENPGEPSAPIPTFRPEPPLVTEPTKIPTPAPTVSPSSPPSETPTSLPTKSPTPSASPTTAFSTSQFKALGEILQGEQENQRFGHSVAISSDGQVLAVGAPLTQVEEKAQAGMVQVYQWNATSNIWRPRGSPLLGRNAQDQLGSAVALSSDGSVLVASEPTFQGSDGRKNRSGNVRSFIYGPTNRYEPLGDEIEGVDATDHFGTSLALSADGRILAVGAPYHDNGGDTRKISGHVRVFRYTSGIWKPQGSALNGSDHLDWFGWSVDLSDSGSVVCAGAPRNLEYGGYVACYEFDGDWSPVGDGPLRNTIEPLRYDDNFGHVVKVSLSSDNNVRVAVGSPGKNADALDSGMAVIYETSGIAPWTMMGSPFWSTNPSNNNQLGFSIDIRESALVIGTPGNGNRGQVDVYDYDYTIDEWRRKLTPFELQGDEGANFGYSLHLSSSALAIGSAVTSGESAGAVRVYSY